MTTSYRIHPATEALDTMLDPSRRDGWTMGDEIVLSGLAVCATLEDLYRYIREYRMCVSPGDRLVAVVGRVVGPDHDALAQRVAAVSYEVLGDAHEWLSSVAEIEQICADWDVEEEG